MKSQLISILALIGIIATMSSNSAIAGDSFRDKHPRRAEVNARERNQQKRIADGIKNGSLSPEEAAKLEKEEGNLKRREVREVKQNGGYLTKREQRQLNRQEDKISKDIYEDKHN